MDFWWNLMGRRCKNICIENFIGCAVMEPISLVTIALTLLATKATEKVGEKIGEGAIAQGKKLLDLLHRKSPETVLRLEAAADPNVIDAVIIEEVQRVAAAEPEVQQAIEATVKAIEADAIGLQHLTKLAEKIGVVNLGKVENQTNNITL